MARFYGTIQGGRGEATRLGHANTGLRITAQSYAGDVRVHLYVQEDEDHCCITVTDHGDSYASLILYDGPIRRLRDRSSRATMLKALVQEELTA